MPRPKRCRRIGATPGSSYFKPRGIPLAALDEIVLSVDEFEAIRLADLEGLYQELAAEKMSVSRQTFGRIVAAAHQKVAEALVRGKALKIEGGAVELTEAKTFSCGRCRHAWQPADDRDGSMKCPSCNSGDIRAEGNARGRGRGRGGGNGSL
jgi:predicted DNA-binding protein (UPF0251 family)